MWTERNVVGMFLLGLALLGGGAMLRGRQGVRDAGLGSTGGVVMLAGMAVLGYAVLRVLRIVH